tara:strand:+ start:470 stop:664 length:195 start_codon:yes stop_codon:yes gene_type:complete
MEKFICPRCKKETSDFPAISRRDNKTEICSDCGVAEAMADYYNLPDNWLEFLENSEPLNNEEAK